MRNEAVLLKIQAILTQAGITAGQTLANPTIGDRLAKATAHLFIALDDALTEIEAATKDAHEAPEPAWVERSLIDEVA